MVRHEAAEALGGIATPEVLPHLKEWMSKDGAPRVVKESCAVAIDMWEVGNLCMFLLRGLRSHSMRILASSNMQMVLDRQLSGPDVLHHCILRPSMMLEEYCIDDVLCL